MGFEYINEEQKIRVALSRRAYNVMQDDMSIFGIKQAATFINTVVDNFKEDSIASLTSYLKNFRDELNKSMEHATLDDSAKTILVDHLCSEKEAKSRNTLSEYLKKEKASSRLYHINNRNFDYLLYDCEEQDLYKDRPGLFIRCILEEYASLPFCEREKIYRKDIFDIVSYACTNNRLMQVKVDTRDGRKTLIVYPYKIVADDMNTQLYLACYTREAGQSSKEKKDASFSMARIAKPIVLKQESSLSKEEKKKIDDDINKLSINYLLETESEIRVRLNKSGITNYHNYVISRPTKDDILSTEDVYVFHCSERQAFNYFYSFGENVEIISPQSLRTRFMESHENALKLYKTKK